MSPECPKLLVSTNTDAPKSANNTFFAGPYYVWGKDLTYNGGDPTKEGKEKSEELTCMELPADVTKLKIEIWPVKRDVAGKPMKDGKGGYLPDNTKKVVDVSYTNAKQLKAGKHRFWDGRCTTGKDAGPKGDGKNGRLNVRGADKKFVDPAFGMHVLKVTIDLKGGKQETANIEFTPRARTLYIYNGNDRKQQGGGRVISEPYPSDGFAYQEAGLAHGLNKRGSITAETGRLKTSRFKAQADASAGTVVYDYADGVSFGKVFTWLTARGKLVSLGHGSGTSIWLDGGNHSYSGFELSAAGIGGADGAKYKLPYLRVHGAEVWLKHCFTAQGGADSQINQIKKILTNNGGGVGGGKVIGYEGLHYIRTVAKFDVVATCPTITQVITNFATVLGALNTKARADITAPQDAMHEMLGGRALTPIKNGDTALTVLAYGFEKANGRATMAGGETFTYTSHEFGRNAGRSVFKGCANVKAHPAPEGKKAGTIYFRHATRGSHLYVARWIFHKFPVEEKGKKARLERFSAEVLKTIGIGAGKKADSFFAFPTWFKGEARGGKEVAVEGGY